MAMMTGGAVRRSMRNMNLQVYVRREDRNPVDHPIAGPQIGEGDLHDLAQDPEFEDLMTARSIFTGEKVNRVFSPHPSESTEDLMKKVKMQRLLGQQTAACFQRCVGMGRI